MQPISSPANPKIIEIRKLKERKQRQSSGKALIEGLKIVGEAVEQGIEVENLVIAPELFRGDFAHQLVEQYKKSGQPFLEVSAAVFESLSVKEGPQGLAAVIPQRWEKLEIIQAHPTLWIALDEIADPGNLGTILRTADAVGAAGVVLMGACTDPYDPSALRACMGSLFNLYLIRASRSEFVEWKGKAAISLVGTSGAARLSYRQALYPYPMILALGSERQGLSQEIQNRCDLMVSIPMSGKMDSLNIAVAAGIVMYEVFHQHVARLPRKVGDL